jgi:hypothetical protein
MEKKASRRAKVTPETLQEAEKMRALWKARPHENQTVFGEKYDVGNQSAVGQFLRGETPLSLKAASGFARGLGCDVSAFSPRLAAEASSYAQIAATAPHAAQEPSAAPASFAPLHGLTIEEVVDKLAEALSGLDDDGRKMASTVLSNLAANPSRTSKAAQMLTTIISLHARAPVLEPDPPAGGRGKRKTAALDRRPAIRPQLTVTAGGGQKMQQDLPLKALRPDRDPFDERNAPANERQWYERVKTAPKAKP